MPKGPPQGPSVKLPQEQGSEFLSFEEFVNQYAGFYEHFMDSLRGGNYREQPYYKKLYSEHTGLAVSLCGEIQTNMKPARLLGHFDLKKALEPCNAKLYKAYKIMRGYGVSDKELFA